MYLWVSYRVIPGVEYCTVIYPRSPPRRDVCAFDEINQGTVRRASSRRATGSRPEPHERFRRDLRASRRYVLCTGPRYIFNSRERHVMHRNDRGRHVARRRT